jgi:hypothetical protein
MNLMTTNKRYLLVDWGYLMFRAIFSWLKTKQATPVYTSFNMLIANLKRVGITENDIVIIATDSPKGSWRKEVDCAYKANRKEAREKHDIDWSKTFQEFNEFIEKLDSYTPFHVIQIDKLEADDIISYGCRKFKDNECVIISADSDYEMLMAFKNVKVFSPLRKKYKDIKNPYALLAQKIKKETADNLVTEIHSQEDYDRRKKIVNLLELPPEIDSLVEERLNDLPTKEFVYEQLPFHSLRERLKHLFVSDKKVDPTDTLTTSEKRKVKISEIRKEFNLKLKQEKAKLKEKYELEKQKITSKLKKQKLTRLFE